MDYRERIGQEPDIMLGKPIVRGTRITVALILRRLSEGASEEELLQSYPQLEHEDILAALSYATAVVSNEEIITG